MKKESTFGTNCRIQKYGRSDIGAERPILISSTTYAQLLLAGVRPWTKQKLVEKTSRGVVHRDWQTNAALVLPSR